MQVDWQLAPDQQTYIHRLAHRYVQFRKSSSVDVDDLISAASMRWWQFCSRNAGNLDETYVKLSFFRHVKGAMRDVVRDSSPVKVTRTMQAQLQAYQRPSAISLDHVIDIRAGDDQPDMELWMDVVASLKKLSTRDQLILSLYIEQGFSYTEIAEVLEVSVSTVTRAYQRALDKIRADIKSEKR